MVEVEESTMRKVIEERTTIYHYYTDILSILNLKESKFSYSRIANKKYNKKGYQA